MADKNQSDWDPIEGERPRPETGSNKPEPDKAKLPPRAADWHSGLKREDPDAYKATAPNTVSDFVTTSGPAAGPHSTSEFSDEPRNVAPRWQTLEFYGRRTRITDWLLGLLLGFAAFFAVATTYDGIGHSWDEALYLKPSERAAAWMLGFFNSGDDLLLQRDAVDRHWGTSLDGNDPLHPEVAPVPKLLNGAGMTYLKPLGYGPMVSMRLPAAILFGLTVTLIFLLGSKEYGRTGGFAAALIYALMPRVFGHAHIAASETPLAFFVILTVWCFLVANRFWPFALFTGIAFGLAIATKIPALMLPAPLMLWGQVYRRRDYATNVFAMAFIAPLVALAVWPWLWYDGLQRFVSYIFFYVDHQKTAVFYMNRKWGYGQLSAPFYYPLHITALALPIWILVFLALGLLRAVFSTIRRPVTILFVLMAASWFGLSMLPQAPRYDGERLFFPVFAFLALLAGGGFAWLFGGFRRWRHRRGVTSGREVNYVAAIALLVMGVLGSAILYFSHPNELNYYNEFVGGPKGAQSEGFETSYWGEAVNEDVTDYLTGILQPGDKVKALALNELALENLRQWGRLPGNVDFSPDEPPYDYVIMQIRQGFMGNLERRLFRSKEPLKVFEAQGVPRIMIFDGATLTDIFGGTKPADPGTTETATITPAELLHDVDTTSTASLVPLLGETTSSISAVDEVTTASGMSTSSLETTTVMVLDLPTSTSETTSTEERLSPVAVELLTRPGNSETSAPGIYDGAPPTTGTALQPVEVEDAI